MLEMSLFRQSTSIYLSCLLFHAEIVPSNEQHFSDLRFTKILMTIGLISEGHRGSVLSRLTLLTDNGRAAAKGVGLRFSEVTPAAAEAISVRLSKLYESTASRGVGIDSLSPEDEIAETGYFAIGGAAALAAATTKPKSTASAAERDKNLSGRPQNNQNWIR